MFSRNPRVWSAPEHIKRYVLGRCFPPRGRILLPRPLSVVSEFIEIPIQEQSRKKAMEKWCGNFGCDALLEKYGKKTAMEMIEKFQRKEPEKMKRARN